MKLTTIDFLQARKPFILEEIFIGDVLEFHDEHNQLFEGRVIRILDDSNPKLWLESCLMTEKSTHSIHFEDGLSIWGGCVQRKIKGGVKGRALKSLMDELAIRYPTNRSNT